MAISEATKKIRKRVRSAMTDMPPIDMRNALVSSLSGIPKDDGRVSVFVSGGVDSHSCLFAAMDLGLNPLVTSFTLDTHESFDFKAAKHVAKIFDLDFEPIILPTRPKHLKKYVLYAVKNLGFRSKADIECGWPMALALKRTAAKHVITGTGSDSYFCLNKTSMMHLRDLVREYRIAYFRKNGAGQRAVLQRFAFSIGKILHMPYFDTRVYAELGVCEDWDTLNTPQKRHIREAWPDRLKECKIKTHTNLQLGDSGISKHFQDTLVDSDWNTRGSKSVTGIYNDVVRGKIT